MRHEERQDTIRLAAHALEVHGGIDRIAVLQLAEAALALAHPYKERSAEEIEADAVKWRAWTFDPTRSESEQKARKAVSAAWLRLARLSEGEPEVAHAMECLEAALRDAWATWP